MPRTQFAYPGGNVELEAIAATSGQDVWATGYVYTGVEFRALALRRHAGSWARVPTPDVETAPAEDFLDGVAALAPSNVWMVGSSATSPTDLVDKPLVEHWNGKTVSIVAAPDPSAGRGAALSAVSGSSAGLWAVGTGENSSFDPSGVVERYEAGAWRLVPFRTVRVAGPFGGFGRFFAVTRDSSGHLLAAGFGIAASGRQIGLVSTEKT